MQISRSRLAFTAWCAMWCAIPIVLPQAVHAEPPAPLTVGRCLDILTGLNLLDNYDRVVGDKIVAGQYKLGTVRFTIAQNMTALRHVQEMVDRATTGLLAEIAQGKPITAGSPELVKLTTARQEILDKPCDVMPGHIRLSDLNVGDGPDQNAIAPSILSSLEPILDK